MLGTALTTSIVTRAAAAATDGNNTMRLTRPERGGSGYGSPGAAMGAMGGATPVSSFTTQMAIEG